MSSVRTIVSISIAMRPSPRAITCRRLPQGAAAQVREPVAPRAGGGAAHARDEADEDVSGERADGERREEAAERDRAQPQVTRLPDDEPGKRAKPQQERREAEGLGRGEVAAQHAQRGSVAKPQQRRKRESQEQHEADGHAAQARQRSRVRKLHREEAGEPIGHDRLEGVAGDAPDERGEEAERDELPRVDREEIRLRRTEAAHHRGGVDLALGETARGERDRDGREDDGQERSEAEEALRALERRLHFAARVAHAVDAFAARELRLHLPAISLDRLLLSAHEQPVADAASHLDELRRLEVVEMDEDAGCQAEVIQDAVGLARDHRPDEELRAPDLQGVAHFRAGAIEKRGRHPRRSHRRCPRSLALGSSGQVCNPELAAQRKPGRHGLDLGKLRSTGRRDHARERARLHHLELLGARRVEERRRDRMIRDHREIATQQLVCLPIERPLHAIGEETDRGHARHRDEKRNEEHAQLPGRRIAPEHSHRDRKSLHFRQSKLKHRDH
jgi:hypothetical protein